MSRFAFHYENLTSGRNALKVFDDPRQLRARRLRRVILALGFGLCLWAGLFLNGAVSWQTAYSDLSRYWGGENGAQRRLTATSQPLEHLRLASLQPQLDTRPSCEQPRQPYLTAMADPTNDVVFAHLPTTFDWAHLSLKDSCNTIGVLVPEWFRITWDGTAAETTMENRYTRMAAEEFRRSSRLVPDLMPTVTLDPGQDKPGFFTTLNSEAPNIVAGLVDKLLPLYAQGACFDFMELNSGDLRMLRPFLTALTAGFEAQGLQSCIVLSATESLWQDAGSMAFFDKVILKMFSEPWVGTAPGPLAPDAWFVETARLAAEALGHDKLVAALGNFAVEWVSGQPLPTVLPYAEAMDKIARAGATVRFSPKTSGSFSAFQDSVGLSHKIWLQDAATLHNQITALSALGISRIGLWSLGQEDPGVWTVLRGQQMTQDEMSADLAVVQLDNFVGYRGDGAFLRVETRQSPGIRQVRFDPETGRVASQVYDLMPRPYTMERYGKPAGRKVVLSFDDGPHPTNTAQVLDSLKATQTPAAFFVTGKSIMDAPDLLKRVIDEGHEVGAHTFSHPRMDQISKTRLDLEFSLLDKIVAGAAGRKTVIYREPFQRSGGPISAERVRPLEAAMARGFQIAGMDIVPRDWEGWSSREITDFVVQEVERGAGNVILLHDGGLNREASVAAVPLIISDLRARGYSFTTMADLLGTTRADLMPVAEGGHQTFDRVSFSAVAGAKTFAVSVFWVILAIGVIRSVVILVLSVLNWKGRQAVTLVSPRVAVIIPAHNEEEVIRTCIESVRASDYRNFEIIVVDDGSTDNTLNEVFKFSHKQDVRLISQPNQGKWSALNRALLGVEADIVVCIDADTQIKTNAITQLVKHFNDPKVGGVAGKIIAGNKVNLLTRMQAFEYATSQNVERMAFDLVNGILVVPGALGAWRVSALRKAGLYSDATLTEDADLTIQVNRAGYRIVYEPRARAYTEVPEQVGQLLKQRLRWSFGMFQSAWKHKSSIFEGRMVGLFSIPDMFIFGYLFPLLAPIADLFVGIMLYKLFMDGGAGEAGSSIGSQPSHYLWAYFTLPALEFLIAAFALARDEDESLWSLLLYPVQRVFYRPLLYYSVIRAVLRAITGRLASWGALKRQGRDYSLVTARS
ncbi:glycosyltransferase [Phaeobacter sp. B1627]|uniref:glycosyltransferase n=1 Tax=Phaeobacter sp. B1627 TaxID=2583809 RepID=UPI0011193561|nr:glycosyltransferase [Phaeobacter sp. B1627]TNJ48379.1 glycosyltransferase [Phaeobacter sp. B1627]